MSPERMWLKAAELRETAKSLGSFESQTKLSFRGRRGMNEVLSSALLNNDHIVFARKSYYAQYKYTSS